MSAPATTVTISDREPFKALDWALFVGVSLIWGSSFLLIAIGLESLHPGLITWMRVGFGALALAAFPSTRRKIETSDRKTLLTLSVIWVGIPFTLFPLAEQHINSAVTGLLNGATPIFAALIGGLFFARPARGTQRLGLIVGFLGMAIVSIGGASSGGETAMSGILMVLVATFFYGVSVNVAGPLQQKYGSLPVMAKMLALGTIWTAPFGVYGLFDSSFAVGPVAATAVLGIVGTGFAFAMMGQLIRSVGGTRGSFTTYLMPVVALILGVVFLRDVVSPETLPGVALVIGGALLASRKEK